MRLILTQPSKMLARLLSKLIESKSPWTISLPLISHARTHRLIHSWKILPPWVIHPLLAVTWFKLLVSATSHIQVPHLLWGETVTIHSVFLVVYLRHPSLHAWVTTHPMHIRHVSLRHVSLRHVSLRHITSESHAHFPTHLTAHLATHLAHLTRISSSEPHALVVPHLHVLQRLSLSPSVHAWSSLVSER